MRSKFQKGVFRPQIIQLLDAGFSPRQVSELLGVTACYVRLFVRERVKKRTIVEKMIAAGASTSEITAAAGCTRQYVHNIRSQKNAPPRREAVIATLKQYADKGECFSVSDFAELIGCNKSMVRNAMCAVYGFSGPGGRRKPKSRIPATAGDKG